MINLRLVLFALTALLCSCASFPFVGSMSPQAARSTARRDFAAGHPKIYYVGGIVASAVGVADADLTLVRKLPQDVEWAGCTVPRPSYARSYATAYNQEVVSLLKGGRAH